MTSRELAGSAVDRDRSVASDDDDLPCAGGGAPEVVPFREIEEALAAAEKAGRERVVLGGERRGVLIEGFDLGNSPAEYTPEAIAGRPVFITTTNGTRALVSCSAGAARDRGGDREPFGGCGVCKDEPRVDILCAGTDGEETLEDILAAGAIVDLLTSATDAKWQLNDAAAAAAANGGCWSAKPS